MFPLRSIRIAFLLLGPLSTPLQAHDLWVEREGAVHALTYGHQGSAHEGVRRIDYRPETVREATCYAATGQPLKAERGGPYPVTLKGDCAATWFLASSGYWSKTPYGTKNLPRTEAGTVLDSWLSVESVKRMDRWGDALARPLTDELELVPEGDPFVLKAGDKLRLRAYFRGQPVPRVSVAYFGKPRGVTDRDGRINVRLGAPGIQLVEATLEQPLTDGKADRIINTTTLQFEIR